MTSKMKITILLFLVALFGSNHAYAVEDNNPPQVTAFNLNPTIVDTENQSQQVNFTVTLTDDQVGVSSASDGNFDNFETYVTIRPVSDSAQSISALLSRTSGDDVNGTYIATVTLPKGSKEGVWNAELFVTDKIGNWQSLYESALEIIGPGPASLTNTASVSDSTAPQAATFNLSPIVVNTQNQSEQVTANVALTDDRAGVSISGNGYETYITLRPESGGTQASSALLNRTSGNDLNGNYTGIVTLPKGSKEGVWNAELFVSDKVGNIRSFTQSDLELIGPGPTSITNMASVSDSTAPQVNVFNLNPVEINTENQSQQVNITVSLTDSLAGVSSTNDGYSETYITLRPLVGTQGVSALLSRTSGDDVNGTYIATVTLPKGSKEGVWNAELFVTDKIGNWQSLSTDTLASMFPNTNVTIVNTAQAQQVTIERVWTLSTPRTSVTFPVGTVVTKQNGGSFAFYQMASQEFAIDSSTSTTNLNGTPAVTLKLGIPGLNLSFSQNVSITFNIDPIYNGYDLQIQSLVEGGDAWANETTIPVINGTATFIVNHATKFAGILVKPAQKPGSQTPGKQQPTAPGSSVTIQSTSLSISASPKSVQSGKAVTIKGQLKAANGQAVANKTVAIKAKVLQITKKKVKKGKKTIIKTTKKWIWKVIARVKTNAKGQFVKALRPKATTIYQAEFAGDSQYKKANSNSAKITVKKPKKKIKKKK